MRRSLSLISAKATRARPLCDFALPAHLKQSFVTPTAPGRCMIVGAPFWRYFIAVVPPEPQVAELIAAIRENESRPFRIISHVDQVRDAHLRARCMHRHRCGEDPCRHASLLSRPALCRALCSQEGKVFNASFFDDPDKMRAFLSWYSDNELSAPRISRFPANPAPSALSCVVLCAGHGRQVSFLLP